MCLHLGRRAARHHALYPHFYDFAGRYAASTESFQRIGCLDRMGNGRSFRDAVELIEGIDQNFVTTKIRYGVMDASAMSGARRAFDEVRSCLVRRSASHGRSGL